MSTSDPVVADQTDQDELLPRADTERRSRVAAALARAGLDALLCARGLNVLLLSGYWPVVGTTLAIATADGGVELLVPVDEQDLAAPAGADRLHAFEPAALTDLHGALDGWRQPLAETLGRLSFGAAALGIETESGFVPTTYASQWTPGAALAGLLSELAPKARIESADDLLAELRARPTTRELECIRATCRKAARAFAEAMPSVRPGASESDVALAVRQGLCRPDPGATAAARADGHAWCMSGENGGSAYGSHARSSARCLRRGDLALVHCNSNIGGYWSDISRSFVIGAPTTRQRAMLDAVFAARGAGLGAIRAGVRAADVDGAVRATLERYGFGAEFRHPTGHGVGFAAIDHGARPRLHPASPDVLEPGMVCNVEPGIYFPGYGGIRHCDMVAVTATGCELLTPFLDEPGAAILATH